MKNILKLSTSFMIAIILPLIFALSLYLIGIRIPILKFYMFMIYGPLYVVSFFIMNINPVFSHTIIIALRCLIQIPIAKRAKYFYVLNLLFVSLWALCGLVFGVFLNQS